MRLPQVPKRYRAPLLALCSAACAFGVLGVLVYRERATFVSFHWQLDWRALAVAFGLLLVGLLLVGVVWGWMMKALGSRMLLRTHFRYYVISHLARRLPGTLWYVAGRGYLYKQDGESLRLVTLASGLELVLTTVAGGLTTLALWGFALRTLPVSYAGVLVIVVLLGVVLTYPTNLRRLLRLVGLQDAPRLRYDEILAWLVMYALVWLLGGLMFYALAYSLVHVGIEHLVYLVGCWCLVGTLSVLVFFLPTNLGFTEAGLSLLLSAVMPVSLAVLVAVLSRLFIIGFEMVAAGVVMGLLTIVFRQPPKLDATDDPAARPTND